MFRRSLTAGLSLAALLAGLASAKPPDLPLPQNDVLAPAMPTGEAPLFFRVRPSVRRTMASCLLFGANPLFALAPTKDYVDFDVEDVEPGTIPALFVAPAADEAPNGRVLFGVGINGDAGVVGAVVAWESPAAKVAIAPDDSMESICPYIRQQKCAADRSPSPFTDADFSDDVLHNLEMLRQAQLLLQNARELGDTGNVGEALQCLNLVHDLCPGGWLDERIEEAAAEVFAACYCGSPQGVGAAEEQTESTTGTIMDKLMRPVPFSYDDAPLGRVIDDLRTAQGINISVDKAALDADEVSLDRPISIKLNTLPLQSALEVALKPLHLTCAVQGDALRITTERGAANEPSSMSLRPCLPPVDFRVSVTLDRLYDEVAAFGLAVAGGGEEQQPPTVVLKGVAKPFVKAAGLDEVGGCKDGGAPISFLEVLKEFAAVEPPGHGEIYLGLDGSVRMFTQIRCGGAVWHVLYSNGSLSVWASPDGGADVEAPAENLPGDHSAD